MWSARRSWESCARFSPFTSCCRQSAIPDRSFQLRWPNSPRTVLKEANSASCRKTSLLRFRIWYSRLYLVMNLTSNGDGGDIMTNECAVIRAKQAAQECAMKATYYRREFTQQAWSQGVAAALLIPLGLILFLRAPAVGFIVFVCGTVAAHGAYSSFRYASLAYGEYNELREDHN
jgi:hypothetical protein